MQREISVDESMISYRGRLSFLQYMPKKPHKWGIKVWVLAELETGYTWNFNVQCGKEDSSQPGVPLGTQVVLELTKDLANKGYHVYFDNYYTSPALCTILLNNGFGSCGTVRLNRKGLDERFKKEAVSTHGINVYKHGDILGLKWKDKKVVSLLTTIHGHEMVSITRRTKGAAGGHKTVEKPMAIDQYNAFMGGVDKAGQLTQYTVMGIFPRNGGK